MTFRFRNFSVYRDAVRGYVWVAKTTRSFPMDFEHLRNQVLRASLSIALNIAEGSAKASDADFRRFIGHSLGSTSEVASALEIAGELELISKERLNEGLLLFESLAKQLGGFSKHLVAKREDVWSHPCK